MKKFFKSELFRETLSYLAVGIAATVVSFGLQFIFTTIFLLSYKVSSIICFALSSPISFTLNRKFTFRADKLPLGKTLLRFYIIVIPCFALSYLAFEPALNWLFTQLNLSWQLQYQTYAKQIIANGIYIVINYLGQKFFAFKKPQESVPE